MFVASTSVELATSPLFFKVWGYQPVRVSCQEKAQDGRGHPNTTGVKPFLILWTELQKYKILKKSV
jgi:hypothetical protein